MAAAAKPPSTSAPSPPIMIRPMRAGMATASAVRISGAARCSVFWIEKAVPKPPRYDQLEEVDRRLAEREQEQREQQRRDARARTAGSTTIFGAARAMPDRKIGPPLAVSRRHRAVSARLRQPSALTTRRRDVAARGHVLPPRVPQPQRPQVIEPTHAFEQVVHVVEVRIEIVVGLVDDDLALVVLERADVDRLLRLQVGDRGVGGLARRLGWRRRRTASSAPCRCRSRRR